VVDVIIWWLLVQVVGFVALPFTSIIFRNLPDKGYFFSKPLGILLLSYLVWLGGSLHLLPNSRGSIVIVLSVLVLASFLILWRCRGEISALFNENLKVVIATEVLFLTLFVLWAILRAYYPEINHTEQPMDFAFLNANLRSDYFPPNDPWLSGHSMNYYYFGYMMMATLTKLSGVPSAIGYNLALALVMALAAGGAMSLVYNLVRGAGGSFKAALGFGLVGILFLAVLANLEGILELLHAHGLGSAGFWDLIGIGGLDSPYHSEHWYPTQHWWWWRASRVMSYPDFIEFPFFSFFPVADLHPHFTALPFTLLALAISLNIFRTPDQLGLRWVKRNLLHFGIMALVLGGLGFLNTWDLPTYAFIFAVAVLAQVYLRSGIPRLLRDAVPFLGLVLASAILLYLPFYLGFRSQVSGISPLILQLLDMGTRPLHYVIIWGLFLFASSSFVLALAPRLLKGKPLSRGELWWAILPFVILLLGWAVADLVVGVVSYSFWEGFLSIVKQLWLVLPLAAVLSFTLLIIARVRHLEAQEQKSTLFPLMLIFCGLLLTLGVELFYIRDLLGIRMNTVFKLCYQAWALLALASAFGLYYLRSRWVAMSLGQRLLRSTWWGILTVLVAGCALYPAALIHSRLDASQGSPTLNGIAFLEQDNPAEHEAIVWLNNHVKGSPTIVEAVGDEYRDYGRVSARTGLPTILGWMMHEVQWRGWGHPYGQRKEDVALIYRSGDTEQARALLEKYDATYVYVGYLERATYGSQGLDEFADFMDVVFSNEGVVIYKLRG